ncbi:hypothetical protein [Nocardia veterana]|uniref:Uncharacterized protein n=1 Tax=Nocardia veterana TaxID=132249 RepID=A0A7X6M0T9_9NOCA|nr:hypothetical protein [Nocardia veterana]NKY87659.1 hypothetical protein [Nocardia veterana]
MSAGNENAQPNGPGAGTYVTLADIEKHEQQELLDDGQRPAPAPPRNVEPPVVGVVAAQRAGVPAPGQVTSIPATNSIPSGGRMSNGQSIRNGGYVLARDESGDYLLTGPGGAKLWGYSGAGTPFDTQSGALVLESDGSLRLKDAQGKPVSTIVSADTRRHDDLVLLYHPANESPGLRWLIEQARCVVQLTLDLLGCRAVSEVPDLSAWLRSKGLPDGSHSSATVDAYNAADAHLSGIESELRALEGKVDAVCRAGKSDSDAVRGKIHADIAELNTMLRAADNHAEHFRAVTDIRVSTHIPSSDRIRTRIQPAFEEKVEKAIVNKVEHVESLVRTATEANHHRARTISGPATHRTAPGHAGRVTAPHGCRTRTAARTAPADADPAPQQFVAGTDNAPDGLVSGETVEGEGRFDSPLTEAMLESSSPYFNPAEPKGADAAVPRGIADRSQEFPCPAFWAMSPWTWNLPDPMTVLPQYGLPATVRQGRPAPPVSIPNWAEDVPILGTPSPPPRGELILVTVADEHTSGAEWADESRLEQGISMFGGTNIPGFRTGRDAVRTTETGQPG